MSRTIALEYTSQGPRISRTMEVSGGQADMQACLLNCACNRGSDFVFPERGTGLLEAAVGGGLIGTVAAQHEANFAVTDTREFVLRGVSGAGRAAGLSAEVALGSGNRLLLRLRLTDVDDRQLALTAPLWLG